MSLVFGVALLCAFVLLAKVLYIGTRLPEVPRWAAEAWVANVFCPALVVLFAFGGGLIVHAVFHWAQQGFGPMHVAEMVAMVAATTVAMILLGRIKTSTTADLTAKLTHIRTNIVLGTDSGPALPGSPGSRRAA